MSELALDVYPDSDPWRSTAVGEASRALGQAETGQLQSQSIWEVRRNEAIREVRETARDARTSNWDGYGAEPISGEVANLVICVIKNLPPRWPIPVVCPEPDGSLGLDWSVGERSIIVSVSPDRIMHFVAMFPNGARRFGRERCDGRLFPDVLRLVQEICAA